MIKLDTILELGKSLTAKSQKGEGGVEVVNAIVKFSALPIDRESIDEVLGMPIGWSQILYDEQGAPLRQFYIGVAGRELRVSGAIKGPKGEPTLALLQAELTDVELTLTNLGALLDGTLTWAARGDEVEDVSELLGKTCTAKWEITDGSQVDMFRPSAASQRATMDILDRMGGKPA